MSAPAPAPIKQLLVLELWNNFSQLAIPREAGRMQRKVMRWSFYAGIHSMLKRLNDDQKEFEGLPLEEMTLRANAKLRAIIDELVKFSEDFHANENDYTGRSPQ